MDAQAKELAELKLQLQEKEKKLAETEDLKAELEEKDKKLEEANEIKNKYAPLPAGEKTSDSVTVAGRIMAIRNNGMFIH